MPPRIRIQLGHFHLTYMPRLAWRGDRRVRTGAQIDRGHLSVRGVGVILWFRTVPSASRDFRLQVVR